MSNSSIWPIDRTLSEASTLGQSGPESDSNEWVLCIHQSSRYTGVLPSDCLVSYPGHLLECVCVCRGVLSLCIDAISIFYSPSWLGWCVYSSIKGSLADFNRLENRKWWIFWLVVWVLWHINLCRLFNAKSIFM